MGKQFIDLKPQPNLPLVDCHCHFPYPNPPKYMNKSYEEQYHEFLKVGGKFLITSAVDLKSLKIMKDFAKSHNNCYLSVGFAPQTVTYTNDNDLKRVFKDWIEYIHSSQEEYISIGEIGLDFHHAKELSKRKQQIKCFKKIIDEIKDLKKPIQIHVRNPSKNDIDKTNPEHPYNEPDALNQIITQIFSDKNIDPSRVMWHCFAGPPEWGLKLAEMGYMLSVITSSYRSKKMRLNTAEVPIKNLLTETDSYWQHPLKYRGFNEPKNAKYSIAAIAKTHNMKQDVVAEKIYQNAIKFFQIPNIH